MPPSVSVVRAGPSEVIVRRWRNPFAWALLAITLLLVGICVALFSATLRVGPWHPVQLVPLGFSLLAAVMGYLSLVRLVNRTTIAVSGGAVTVCNGPLPWRGGCSIAIADLEGLGTRTVVTTYGPTRAVFHRIHARRRGSQQELCLLDGDVSQREAEAVLEALGRLLRSAGAAGPQRLPETS